VSFTHIHNEIVDLTVVGAIIGAEDINHARLNYKIGPFIDHIGAKVIRTGILFFC
jgi:hypothetical protein